MSKHTPGPWEYLNREFGPVVKDSIYIIPGTVHGNSIQESEANARLIAAAPELLEALKLAINFTVITGDPESVFMKCHKAIAKAEGCEE